MKKIFLCLFVFLSTFVFAKEVILVQGAMDMEVDYLVSKLENPKKEQVTSWTFWQGKMGENEVIVSRTEIGLVNASSVTTLAILKYKPSIIINQGTSGGHDSNLHAGDIVLGSEIINFGAIRTERKEMEVPANYKDGIFFSDVQRLRDKDENFVENPKFYSDTNLLEKAQKINYLHGKVVSGVIGSADQWNRELERIGYLHKTFNTSVEEMESSAVAQISKAYNIPFIAIRVLSNSEIHSEEFNPDTARWCQEFTVDFIKSL